MVADRRRAQAPPRPHPQPGVDGAGLRRPRAGDLRGGYRGPGQRRRCRRDGRSGKIAPAENALSGALRSLFAVAENYPQLRAVESFLQLQETLTATEDKIEYARRYYNTSARDYNIALQTFPRNVIAGPFGFKAVAFFAADEEDRAVPQVNFPGSGPARPARQPAAAACRRRRGPSACCWHPRARRQPAETRRSGTRSAGQTDWPEAIFSSAAMRSSIGGWVS